MWPSFTGSLHPLCSAQHCKIWKSSLCGKWAGLSPWILAPFYLAPEKLTVLPNLESSGQNNFRGTWSPRFRSSEILCCPAPVIKKSPGGSSVNPCRGWSSRDHSLRAFRCWRHSWVAQRLRSSGTINGWHCWQGNKLGETQRSMGRGQMPFFFLLTNNMQLWGKMLLACLLSLYHGWVFKHL